MLYYRGPDMGGGVGGINYSCQPTGNGLNYKHYNLRGDVILTSSSTGNVLSQMHYNAFGNHMGYGTIPSDSHRANTKVTDDGGLILDGHRYRDPYLMRFISPDPLEYVDGLNCYTYCNNNPWGRFDPEGLFGAGIRDSKETADSLENTIYSLRKLNPSSLGIGAGTYISNIHRLESELKKLRTVNGHSDFTGGNFFDYNLQDNDSNTAPSLMGNLPSHFRHRTPEMKKELLSSIEARDEEQFGRVLHQLQDTYSHTDAGFEYKPPTKLGHIFAGTTPDENPEAWKKAEAKTKQAINLWESRNGRIQKKEKKKSVKKENEYKK